MTTDWTRVFWTRARPDENGCWHWLGSVSPSGYGRLEIRNIEVRAHRYAYELVKGPIPEGLVADHLCRVRDCVNPDHLEAVTQDENLRRSRVARKLAA